MSGDIIQEVRHAHLFCGLGGGAGGFNRGEARVGHMVANFRCIGGIDVDAAACRDFEKLAGVPATVRDLFDRQQYIDFHGKEPPAGWVEAGPDDIRRAFNNERPHIVFLSSPCKGLSGLLSENASKSIKYQALNRLTVRGVWLMLEAYGDDPPELIIFENVPRIATRGRYLLDQIVRLLRAYGYAVAETTHDCGEIGNLAQSRKRFLLVARHASKVQPFLYEPIKRPLRGVGEVLERLPMPLSGFGGPMHRMPSLHWKTWVRLAFVEAGSDWRSLNKLKVENGVLSEFGIAADTDWHRDVLGVKGWNEPSPTITGRGTPTNGSYAVADPRGFSKEGTDFHGLRVNSWDDVAGAVTTQRSPGSSAQSVADPRVDGHEKSVQLGVRRWGDAAGVVTGKMFVGGGPHSVADPRIPGNPRFNNVFRIVRWGDPSPAVTGPGGAGGLAVADPRTGYGDNTHRHVLAVREWDEHAKTITGSNHPAGGAGCVADPRPIGGREGKGKYRVTGFDEAAGTVIAASTTGQGATAVADPRFGWSEETAHESKMAVRDWEEPAKTVTGSDRVGSGAQSVADPRWREGRENYQTGGHYGVVPWDQPSGGITAAGQHDNGRNSVADPRETEGEPFVGLPGPSDRLIAVIRALDGTWHRPFTTLELAALQGLVDPDETLELDGLSDAAWRERIGNAVPRPAAQAIAGVMGRTLLLAWSGETFALSMEPVWVRPVVAALMAAQIEPGGFA